MWAVIRDQVQAEQDGPVISLNEMWGRIGNAMDVTMTDTGKMAMAAACMEASAPHFTEMWKTLFPVGLTSDYVL